MFISFLALGYLEEADVCGIKWVSGYPANMKQKLPTIVGMIILNNPDTGEWVCILCSCQSSWLSMVPD